jgi:hypothetical protein
MNQSLQGLRPVAIENISYAAAKFDCQSAVACGIDSRVGRILTLSRGKTIALPPCRTAGF